MLNLQLPPAVMQDISCTHSAGDVMTSDAQVMQYGSQSANMGNHIYKTIAEWIYFQTYHCTGKLETKDIRLLPLSPRRYPKISSP